MAANANNTTLRDMVVPGWTFVSLQITGFFTFFIGFPTNLIIIYLVARKRRLRKPTNFFVSSLATADILVLLWMVIWILSIQTVLSNDTYIIPSIDIFMGVASMVNVACVSADRMIAVMRPLKYEFIMTKRRSLIAILSIWTYAFVLLIAAFLRLCWKGIKYQIFVLYAGFFSYFVPVTTIFISYGVIFVVIVRKLKSISELERFFIANNTNNGSGNTKTSDKKLRRRRKLLRELKVTGNILLIVVPFTTGWTYFIGVHIYEHAYKTFIKNETHNIAMIVVPWILSGLNPIVYLLLNRSLRKGLLEIVKKLCRQSATTVDDVSFFSSFSRRASNALRRASAGIEEGSAGLLNIPRFLHRRRDSRLSSTPSRSSCDVAPSRSSCDVGKELGMTSSTLHEVKDETDENTSSQV